MWQIKEKKESKWLIGVSEMKKRLKRPEAGNKYYITKSAGGWSNAIIGKPTDKYCNVLSNCVGYAYGRFHEIAQRPEMDLFDPVNAEDIYENAQRHGLKVGKTPKPGALIVWEGVGKKAGHVAVVEQVNESGSIVTSESGYNCATPFWTQVRYNDKGNWGQAFGSYRFKGFVYQNETPITVLKKGDKGEDVKTLQRKLEELGWYYDEIDGNFGNHTLEAVVVFQWDKGLSIDGIVGPETQDALGMR